MKSEKGMGHLMLILCIIIILVAIISILYIAHSKMQEGEMEDYKTDMLLIQSKVKILSQESTIQKKEELLKGKKVADNLEDEIVKKLIENKTISQEEKEFTKYYILEKATLEEMGLNTISLKEGVYVVNYDTDEIIYSEGIKIKENIYYKLSDLQKIDEENETKENIEMQDVNEEAANVVVNEAV